MTAEFEVGDRVRVKDAVPYPDWQGLYCTVVEALPNDAPYIRVQRRDGIQGLLLPRQLEACEPAFAVGGRVRCGAFTGVGSRRGVVCKWHYGYGQLDRFAWISDGGAKWHSRADDLEPLTEVWKVVRPDLGSVFAGRSTGVAADYATVTYSASKEVPLGTAFASLDVAKDFAAAHTLGGFSCGRELHIYRAEGVVDGQAPEALRWFRVAKEDGLSVRHLMLVERVAVYRDGEEVVMEDPWMRRVADALAGDVLGEEEQAMATREELRAMVAVVAATMKPNNRNSTWGTGNAKPAHVVGDYRENAKGELRCARADVNALADALEHLFAITTLERQRAIRDGTVAWPAPDAEREAERVVGGERLRAAKDRADHFQAEAERLRKRVKMFEEWREAATERSLSLCALLGVRHDAPPATTMQRITAAIASLMRTADRLRGEASAPRGRLKEAEKRADLCGEFRERVDSLLAQRADLRAKLKDTEQWALDERCARDALANERAADAPLVEAAVRVRQGWATDRGASGDAVGKLVRAVEAHPAYQAAEAEPAPEPEPESRAAPLSAKMVAETLVAAARGSAEDRPGEFLRAWAAHVSKWEIKAGNQGRTLPAAFLQTAASVLDGYVAAKGETP